MADKAHRINVYINLSSIGVVSSYIERNYVYSDIALLIDADNHSFVQLLNSVLAIHRTAISHTATYVLNKTLNFCF